MLIPTVSVKPEHLAVSPVSNMFPLALSILMSKIASVQLIRELAENHRLTYCYNCYILLPVLEGGFRNAGEGLLTNAWSDRKRDNGFKLYEAELRRDMRKKFFFMTVARHWNKLSREAVEASRLEVMKACLSAALSNSV